MSAEFNPCIPSAELREVSKNVYEWKRDSACTVVFKKNLLSEQKLASELAVLKRLNHPNIVRVLGRPSDEVALLMEYAGNQTLGDILQKEPLTLNHRYQLALQAAHALCYVHSLQPPVIHRDIKGLNMMVDRAYVLYLIDFGISREQQSTQGKTTTVMGTAAWMAPEQLDDSKLTVKADVYGFGGVLIELFTTPYVTPWMALHGSMFRICKAVACDKQTPPELQKIFDSGIQALAADCLQHDPQQRPTMQVVLQRLLASQASLSAADKTGAQVQHQALPPPPQPQVAADAEQGLDVEQCVEVCEEKEEESDSEQEESEDEALSVSVRTPVSTCTIPSAGRSYGAGPHRFTQPMNGIKHMCIMWDNKANKCKSRGFELASNLAKHITNTHHDVFFCVWGCDGRYECRGKRDLLNHVKELHPAHVCFLNFAL
jgi:serine/threonine protein kinase